MSSELRKRIKAQVALESLQAYREGAREVKPEVSRDEIVDNILDAVIEALPEEKNMTTVQVGSIGSYNYALEEVKSILLDAKEE